MPAESHSTLEASIGMKRQLVTGPRRCARPISFQNRAVGIQGHFGAQKHVTISQGRCDSDWVTSSKGANLRVRFATRRPNGLNSTGSQALRWIGMRPGPPRRQDRGPGDAESEAAPERRPCSAPRGSIVHSAAGPLLQPGAASAGAAVEATRAPTPRGFKARAGRQGPAAPWVIARLDRHGPVPGSGRPGRVWSQLPRRAADLAPPRPDKADPQPDSRPDDAGKPRVRRRGRPESCGGPDD
jgi:hypothetical protein